MDWKSVFDGVCYKKKYKNCGVMDVDERKCEISHKHPGHLLEEIQDVKIDYLHINKILE